MNTSSIQEVLYRLMISPWTCDFLRKQFLQKTPFPMKEKRERIYISRKSASLRRVLNEQDVIQF